MANWAIFDWIRLRRLVGIDPATPLDTQEGQVRYQRSSDSADGLLYLARRTSGGTMEWKDLTAAGGGGGTTITVQEGDSTVDASVTTLDFNGSDFNVTSSPAGEANVSLAYGTSAGTPAEGNHDHNADYVNVTGDTMTGALVVNVGSTGALKVQNGGVDDFKFDTLSHRLHGYSGSDVVLYSDTGATPTVGMYGGSGTLMFDSTTAGVTVSSGTGTPESAVTAPIGSLFLRSDGGTDTAVYRKESGTGNTGWVAIAAGSGSGLTHPQVMSRAWLVS